jgi:hypothetical protein
MTSLKYKHVKNAVEYDVTTRWRHRLIYMSRPGVCKAVKRQINKRDRRESKEELRRAVD